MKNFNLKWVSLLVFIVFTSCVIERDVKIYISNQKPLIFSFSNSQQLAMLYVYKIVPNKSIELDKLDNNPNLMWLIEGSPKDTNLIEYGVTPLAMKEVIKAKKLEEGQKYLVSGLSANGTTKGTQFIITQGLPVTIK